MSTGIVTLSSEGWKVARALAQGLHDAVLYAHASVMIGDVMIGDGPKKFTCSSTITSEQVNFLGPSPSPYKAPIRFEHIIELTGKIFQSHNELVFIAPCGVVVRAIASHIDRKTADPAVVVVDAGGRFAVSLLSGHEGGANRLAVTVANIVGAEPVISTTTEARKNIIVGVGCRKNISKSEVVRAIVNSLEESALLLDEVRLIATADIKRNETGLIEAANELNVPLLFVSSARIRTFGDVFEKSILVQKKVGLPAVAEPACMLAGRNTKLIAGKRKCNRVTIAIARESCLWSV